METMNGGRKIPDVEQTARPWRIHEVVRDFRLEDVWALPASGGQDDFPRLVHLVATVDPADGPSRAARTLWAVRWKLGELFGWDDQEAGLASRVPTLRDRLPADLRGSSGPSSANLPFIPLYVTGDEFAAEIANATMHGVMHLSWVPEGDGVYRGQMSVYVRPNGFAGRLYMAAIRPFRYTIVYPAMMRQLEREWAAGPSAATAEPAAPGGSRGVLG